MIKKTIYTEKAVFIGLAIYVLLLLFFCSKMSSLYPINDWADVNLYFTIGKAIFNGQVPYTDTFDHKGPLIFFIYGIGSLFSKTSFLGIYFIQVLTWIVMVFAAYLTARHYLSKAVSAFVAMLMPSFMLSHTLNGGSAEEFITAAACVSLYLFISYFNEKEASAHCAKYMLVHGVMCAIAIFIKINLVAFWIFPLAFIFINLLIKKEYRNLLLNAAALIVGILFIALPIILYFLINNGLSEAWNVYIELNRSYSNPGTIGEIAERLFSKLYQPIRFGDFEFVIILIGAIYFPIRYIKNTLGKLAITLSFLALFVAIFVSSYYIDYYSVPLYIYIPLGCIIICKYINIKESCSTYIILAVIAFYIGIQQRKFFNMDIGELVRRERAESGPSHFADLVKQEKNPTLLNLGLDLGNCVFTEADVMPNVKYFITPNLPHEMFPQMRNEQTKYIEDKKIQFIILSQASGNFGYFRQLPALNESYTVIDSFAESPDKIYYLYKRND